jgi:hypothetical protein
MQLPTVPTRLLIGWQSLDAGKLQAGYACGGLLLWKISSPGILVSSAPAYLLPHQAVSGEPYPIIGPTTSD